MTFIPEGTVSRRALKRVLRMARGQSDANGLYIGPALGPWPMPAAPARQRQPRQLGAAALIAYLHRVNATEGTVMAERRRLAANEALS
jgi:hypothetical protein